jgi:TonB family protein
MLSGVACVWAQERPKQLASIVPTPHPPAVETLRRQFGEILQARQAGDGARLDALLKSFALPDPETWTARLFAPQQAPALAQEYAREYSGFQSAVKQVLDHWESAGDAEIRVAPWERRAGAEAAPSADFPVPAVGVAVESYMFMIGIPGRGAVAWVDSFAYLHGAWRFIGKGSSGFWSAPHFTVPSANFQMAHAIYKVPPNYPPDAQQQAIEGPVRLRATITADGTVRELTVMEGHPLLAPAAVEAVRQWRYAPAQLRGKPVEVPTTVEVDFLYPRSR